MNNRNSTVQEAAPAEVMLEHWHSTNHTIPNPSRRYHLFREIDGPNPKMIGRLDAQPESAWSDNPRRAQMRLGDEWPDIDPGEERMPGDFRFRYLGLYELVQQKIDDDTAEKFAWFRLANAGENA
jgi:hypothetical protein